MIVEVLLISFEIHLIALKHAYKNKYSVFQRLFKCSVIINNIP